MANEVARHARPSMSSCGTAMIESDDAVNGETIDASASESAMPTCAMRSAPQSLPPSPVIATMRPRVMCICATSTLSAGEVRAQMRVCGSSRSIAPSAHSARNVAESAIASSTGRSAPAAFSDEILISMPAVADAAVAAASSGSIA